MQPYVILKKPGKAVFYLFTIMFLIVRDSHELGPCFQNCFGPVTKIRVYNELSHGYLHVNGTNVVATPDGDGFIYKISAGQNLNFYLYDMKAEKFICWRRPRVKGQHPKKHIKSPYFVARRMISSNCKFIDKVVGSGGYVNLETASEVNIKLKFNVHGKIVSKECLSPVNYLNQSTLRHKHRCNDKQANFLIDTGTCECPEARYHFCKPRFSKMKVFKTICSLSNETYNS